MNPCSSRLDNIAVLDPRGPGVDEEAEEEREDVDEDEKQSGVGGQQGVLHLWDAWLLEIQLNESLMGDEFTGEASLDVVDLVLVTGISFEEEAVEHSGETDGAPEDWVDEVEELGDAEEQTD